MSDYRSAYERYYKNINNTANGKKESNKYLPLSSRNDSSMNLKYGTRAKISSQGNYFVKRMIRELVGAMLLLVIFFGMKFIPLNQVQEVYTISKQTLTQTFDYDKCIETFSYVKIGNFKLEDMKKNNIKLKVSQFVDYLKNVSKGQVKTGI